MKERLRLRLAAVLLFGAGTLVAAADDGAEHYAEDCAVCHGLTAAGDGPLAAQLTIPPSNLRRLSIRHGSFPEEYVRKVVDGRDLPPTHGVVAMPVWGREYNRALAGQGERRVQERLDALVAYLRSIQDP